MSYVDVLLREMQHSAIQHTIKSGLFIEIIEVHKPTNNNSMSIHTNSRRSVHGSADLILKFHSSAEKVSTDYVPPVQPLIAQNYKTEG